MRTEEEKLRLIEQFGCWWERVCLGCGAEDNDIGSKTYSSDVPKSVLKHEKNGFKINGIHDGLKVGGCHGWVKEKEHTRASYHCTCKEKCPVHNK